MNFIDDKEKINDLLWLSRGQFLNSYSYITEKEYDNTLNLMWEQLGNIPTNENGTLIEEDFYNWEKGAEKEKIWHWFDDRLEEFKYYNDRITYAESCFIVNALEYYWATFKKETSLSEESLNDYRKIIDKYCKLENQIMDLRIKEE